MTHDELLASIIDYGQNGPIDYGQIDLSKALRAVVELHKEIPSRGANYPAHFPSAPDCAECSLDYPCPTIQAIEKELNK